MRWLQGRERLLSLQLAELREARAWLPVEWRRQGKPGVRRPRVDAR
ncbi:MAG TPA: hypothetical protein VH208_00985 [Myxococcaceae bacterium]|nr:hypothetical protein [Myxococcaceae bacterium]